MRGREPRSSRKCERVAEVSSAAAMSSPPLNATVPAPKAPVLPKGLAHRLLLRQCRSCSPSLSDTKPESTVNAPAIVCEPPFSNSAG